MDKIINMFSKVWSWLCERTVIWIVFVFFMLISWGQVQKSDIAIQVKEEHLNCKIECLPASSEYFTNQCWCYQDEQTLVKSTQR